MSEFAQACAIARSNVLSQLRLGNHLPERVMNDCWLITRFLDKEPASELFFAVLQELLETEAATACYLIDVNIVASDGNLDGFCVEAGSTEKAFLAQWLQPPNRPRVAIMEAHAISSDRGEWFIFCDRASDVGLIAFRTQDHLAKFEKSIATLEADRLDVLLRRDSERFPFNVMVSPWKRGLVQHYA